MLQDDVTSIISMVCFFLSAYRTEMNTMSIDIREHSHLPVYIFCPPSVERSGALLIPLSSSTVIESERSWQERKNIMDKLHRHVCGHASYEGINIFLERNQLWNDQCTKYLAYLGVLHGLFCCQGATRI